MITRRPLLFALPLVLACQSSHVADGNSSADPAQALDDAAPSDASATSAEGSRKHADASTAVDAAAVAASDAGDTSDGASELMPPDSGQDSPFSAALKALAPVGYWRLGEQTGSQAIDSSGHEHHGEYINAPGTTSGAIASDSDAAMQVSASEQQYVEIPDHDDFSLTKAQDTFARTVELGSSWGQADHGGSWQPDFASGPYYSCDGTSARIHQTKATNYGQSLPGERADVDIQIKVSWSESAAGAATRPVMLLARMQDASTYYFAELRENVGGALELRIRRTGASGTVVLAPVQSLGSYVAGDIWYVRFQLEGQNLRAKAWKADALAPAWQITASDSVIAGAGRVAIHSTNSGATSRPIVTLDDFRVQSVGMSVHAFVRVDALDFGPTDGSGYVHWLGKGVSAQHEWAFRLYPSSDVERANRMSAYAWNRAGAQGAGGYFQDALVAGQWLEVVALYDAGDALDSTAGVTLYRDGVKRKAPPSSGTLYSNADYRVMPENGTAPLRLGTRDLAGFLTGALDEVAVFDRKLSDAEILSLHDAAR